MNEKTTERENSPIPGAAAVPTRAETNPELVRETNLQTKCAGNGRTLQEACDEVQREFNVRERCFPKWVAEGRLAKSDATDRLERLAAACYFLQCLSYGNLAGSMMAEVEASAKAALNPAVP